MKKEIGFALALGLAGVFPAEVVSGRAHADRAETGRARSERTKEQAQAKGGEELISLDLKDADLRDVLRTFATLEHINIAIDPEVRGSVTIRLNDVAWDQALEVILRSNGLGSVVEGNVLRIGTPARLADR